MLYLVILPFFKYAYHSAVEKAAPEKPKEAEPKKGKRAAKKKHSEIDL